MPRTPPKPSRFVLLLFAALAGLVAPAPLRAEVPTPPTTAAEPIVGIQGLWSLDGGQRNRPHRFQIDAVVHYYDPVWRQLWAQEGDRTFFLAPPGAPLPIRSGEFVRLTGVTTPANLSQVATLSTTVLAERPVITPLATAGHLADFIRFNERLVEIDALVESQTLVDPNHLHAVLVAEGIQLEANIWLETDDPAPVLTDSFIRVQGVYCSRLDPDGRLQSITVAVPSIRRITTTGHIRSDPRFEAPLAAIEHLPEAEPATPLHVAGRIVSIAPGRAIVLRDRTGQLEVLTPQSAGLQANDEVEAVGYPVITAGRWQLRQALLRRTAPRSPAAGAEGRPLLRLAAQVLALPRATAEARQSVLLQGVVTWSAPGAQFIYLQDPSGGVRIEWSDPTIAVPEINAGLAVEGFSAMGAFAPTVTATRFVSRYVMSPPDPLRLSLYEAESGTHEAQWVEMSGLLREVRPSGRYAQLMITTATGDFDALVPSAPVLDTMRGSFIRVRGVCTALTNERRQLTGIRLRVPAASQVEIEEPPPADLFALPINSIASLRQFGPFQAGTHWQRTHGIVTYQLPGGYLIIQDSSEALTVLPDDEAPIRIGSRVDVVGVPGRDGPRLVLRNARLRPLGNPPSIQPVPLDDPTRLDEHFDSRLVRITGTLDEVTELGGGYFLEIRQLGQAIVARLPVTVGTPLPATWSRGCVVELTGIYRLSFDEHRRRTGFDLLLRSPADVHILVPAPWWTADRIRVAATILGLCVAFGFLWVILLRRKIRQQTLLLRTQLAKEAHLEAELERAQRLHSLGTLAGGIAHDFNNLLTVIMGNVTFAMLDERVMALAGDCLKEAEAGAQRAREITQQMLTFARGGDPVREDFALPPLVHETVALALSGAGVRAEVYAPPTLRPVQADRAQVHRALHNLLAHANRSMPRGGIVTIDLANETIVAGQASPLAAGRYVRIQISDRGEAIPAERLPSVFDPYAAAREGDDRFGLATAYSIAHKHGGHLGVESVRGRGTTFTLWLQASDAAAAPRPVCVPPAPAEPPAPPPAVTAGARVLVMDDEEGIRLLASMILEQMQCESVVVPDGAACLAAYRGALAEGRPFDLVVMDLTIPGGMGGRETIAELRKIDPAVRAIVSSGYANDQTLTRYREHGFVAVVPKPYETKRLASAITRALAERPGR